MDLFLAVLAAIFGWGMIMVVVSGGNKFDAGEFVGGAFFGVTLCACAVRLAMHWFGVA